jgi:hypothetical protein
MPLFRLCETCLCIAKAAIYIPELAFCAHSQPGTQVFTPGLTTAREINRSQMQASTLGPEQAFETGCQYFLDC